MKAMRMNHRSHHANRKQQPHSSSSELGAIDSSVEHRSQKNIKASRQSKRVVTTKVIRGCIGKFIPKLRPVRCELDSRSISTTTAESPKNSTDDGPIVADGPRRGADISRSRRDRSPSSSSPSRSSSESSRLSRERDDTSISRSYRILPQVTGQGIAGEVRRCIHRETGSVRAVKTISKERVHRKDRIRREVSLSKRVDHPSIISTYDVFEDEDEVNIVMELCRGGELFDRIVDKAASGKAGGGDGGGRRGPACFREKDAARIIHSLLSAVSYLHSEDIVHRDIKPENILFVEEDEDDSPIRLIDFGLSVRHPRGRGPLTTTVGTSYYMAPELLDGSYDRACDLWSVGVVAYVMLSGRPPFNGPSDDVIFKKILRGLDCHKMETSAQWDGVSKYAKDFVRCLLVMDPARRLTADMALDHPWLKVAKQDAQSESGFTERTRSC